MNIKSLLTTTLLVSSLALSAQNRDIAYAITGDGNNDFTWMNIRQVDLSTGKVVKTLFERSKTNYTITDIRTKKTVDQSALVNGNVFASKDYPTSTYVAAAAYDIRSNKLFFTPMRMGELRWLDLNIKNEQPKFFTLQTDAFLVGNVNDEANHITRMVIAADGYGYAITNDGNHLFRFTTGKTPVITDLGNLIDADSNNGISVHNKCSSWGGDMLADAFGKLYVISANKNVFVVDINTRITSFKGTITGLPVQYTTNGAAVAADGNIIVTSANFFNGYYKFAISDLSASKITDSDIKYNASDLANGRLLLQKEANAANKFSVSNTNLRVATYVTGEAKVFPNPVTTSTFNVNLSDQQPGLYSIILSDVVGRTLQTKTVSVIKGNQTEQVNILSRPAKGVYMVKVLDAQNQVVITEKIVLE
ncbi:MAG: T9SS type A sorting domain-containing protein [Ferruginibacter sp.]